MINSKLEDFCNNVDSSFIFDVNICIKDLCKDALNLNENGLKVFYKNIFWMIFLVIKTFFKL